LVDDTLLSCLPLRDVLIDLEIPARGNRQQTHTPLKTSRLTTLAVHSVFSLPRRHLVPFRWSTYTLVSSLVGHIRYDRLWILYLCQASCYFVVSSVNSPSRHFSHRKLGNRVVDGPPPRKTRSHHATVTSQLDRSAIKVPWEISPRFIELVSTSSMLLQASCRVLEFQSC
jgi:hypothetical protein